MNNRVYFDHNSTALLFSKAAADMISCINEPLNPSSLHYNGRRAKILLEDARERIGEYLGASKNYNVIFTSSGTEANNLALRGVGLEIITTATEHASVLNVVGKGVIAVNRDGLVELDQLENLLKNLKRRVLISVIMANNETGVIQPIPEISRIVKEYNCLFHIDAVQAFGKIPFNISRMGVDLATVSSHKFGGPVGAACLAAHKDIMLEPMIFGGGQESRLRSGTQNVVAIHGFGSASEVAYKKLSKYQVVEELRDYIEKRLKEICPNLLIFGENAPRLPNTSSVAMPNVKNEIQLMHFDLNGISVSAGSACSSSRLDYPHVQIAMGYSAEIGVNAIRISLGRHNTRKEADYFIQKWEELYKAHNYIKGNSVYN